jgi:HEAT repeat protein
MTLEHPLTLRLVATAGVLVAVLTVLLALQVLVLRLRQQRRTRRTARTLELWRPLLFLAAEGPSPSLPPIAAADAVTVLTLWNHLQESVAAEARDRLNAVARRLGFHVMARRMVRRRGMSARLLGITTLGQLQDRESWEPLCAFTASPSVVVSVTAARALIRIDRQAAIDHLMPAISSRLDWPAALVATLLAAAGADVVSAPLVHAVEHAAPREAARLLRFLDIAHSNDAIPVVRRLLRHADDVDVIAACLRVFKDHDDLDVVRRLLDDERWQVRVQATAALGRMGTAEDEPRLARCLADPEWWVRYRAAQGLCALLADAQERLDRLQRDHPNPFARDVLAQVRAEARLGC